MASAPYNRQRKDGPTMTHASALIAAGIDVVKISKRLDHASPTVTLRIYAHLFNPHDKAAAVAIDA